MTKATNLTDSNKLTLGAGFHQDAKEPNLRLMVSPLGKRSWFHYGWAPAEGKAVKRRFADAEEMPVKDARAEVKRRDAAFADKAKGPTGRVPTFGEVVQMKDAAWVTRTFNSHFKDWLGLRLDKLTSAMVVEREALVRAKAGAVSRKRAAASGNGLPLDPGGTAVTNAAKALRSVFKFALDKELFMGKNVGKAMTLAEDREPRKVWLSDAQRAAFWDALDNWETNGLAPWARPCFAILIATGSRWGALASARWEYVDLDNKLWTIPPSNAKNGETNYVHLSEQAVDLFKQWRELNPNAAWVFPSPKDPRNHIADIWFQWGKLKELAGLQGIRPHDLRRTFGSMLVSRGAPMKIVSKMLNHKSVRVTEQVYAHVDPKEIHKALSLLG